MGNSNDKVLIIGPIPKNHGIGGVSIHVQRLLDFLDANAFPYSFADYKRTGLAKLNGSIRNADFVHLHVSNPMFQLCLVVLCKLYGKKIVVTLHGNYGRFGRLKNLLVRICIRLSTVPIVINEKSFEVCRRFSKNTVFIPAFIPPQKEEDLQPEIVELLKRLRDEGMKIFSTNAYNISYDKKGNDIYGIDFLVQYFKYNGSAAVVISDPSGNYKKCYPDLQSRSVYFIDYPHPYFELLKHVDYFVRNTSTDGDALSVKEALYLGVPTLCTDVVDRPDGVRLFKYCDMESFEKAMITPVEGNNKIENGAGKIVGVYERLMKD